MLFDRKGLRVFIYCESVDMRCGFERLHSYCVHGLKARMDQGHLYLFFGKNRRRLKVLWYDGTGLMLASKRIERGSFMRLEDLLGRTEITQKELEMILHGSVIRTPLMERAGLGFEKSVLTQRESVAQAFGVSETFKYVESSRETTS